MSDTKWHLHPWLLATVPALIVGIILWPKGQQPAAISSLADAWQWIVAAVTHRATISSGWLAVLIAAPMILAWFVGRISAAPSGGLVAVAPSRPSGPLSSEENVVLAAMALAYDAGNTNVQRGELQRMCSISYLILDATMDSLLRKGLIEAPYGFDVVYLSSAGRRRVVLEDYVGKIRAMRDSPA